MKKTTLLAIAAFLVCLTLSTGCAKWLNVKNLETTPAPSEQIFQAQIFGLEISHNTLIGITLISIILFSCIWSAIRFKRGKW